MRRRLRPFQTFYLNFLVFFIPIDLAILIFDRYMLEIRPVSIISGKSRKQISLEELNTFFNFPTWSPSFKNCTDPKSEVTCEQVYHSYIVINNWLRKVSEHKKNLKCDDIITIDSRDGIGNRIMSHSVAMLFAIFSGKVLNRERHSTPGAGTKVFVEAFKNPENLILDQVLGDLKCEKVIPLYLRWKQLNQTNYDMLLTPQPQTTFFTPRTYIYYLYTNDYMGEFLYKNFGIHAYFFIGNYLCRLPEESIKFAQERIEKIPKSLKIVGVHLRYHREKHAFVNKLSQAMKVLIKFIDSTFPKNAVIGVASDSSKAINLFKNKYGDRTFAIEMERNPDYDHYKATFDIALLMLAHYRIVTQLSTFSYLIPAMLGQPAYYYHRDLERVLKLSNSQAGVMMLFRYKGIGFHFNDNMHVYVDTCKGQKNFIRHLYL